MKSKLKTQVLLLLSSFLLFLFASCASNQGSSQNEAENLFKQAEYYVSKKRFLVAQEKLNDLKTQYPYSIYSSKAELLLADILFAQENYIEAAAAYLSFRDLHPKNEEMNYVIWRIAESYYNQMPSSFDRDLSAAKESIKYYKELLSLYPESNYAKDSTQKIDKVNSMVLNQDLYIADFYYRTDVYDSSRHRYLDLLKNYPSNEDVQNLGKIRIIESSYYLKEYQACLDYCKDYLGGQGLESSLKNKIEKWQRQCTEMQTK